MMLRLSDFKNSSHEGGKVVSPTHRPPLPPYPREIFLVIIYVPILEIKAAGA